jgi:predicted permease
MEAMLGVIAQIFIVIGVGSVVVRSSLPIVGRFDGAFWKDAARLCYNLCLASLLFLGTSEVRWDGQLAYLAAMAAVGLLALAAAAAVCAWCLPLCRDAKPLVAVIAFNPSSAFFGIPLAVGIFGNEIVAQAALVSTVETGIATALAVALLGGAAGRGAALPGVLRRVAVDPLVFSTAAGALVSMCGIELPQPVTSSLRQLAGAAIPLALLTIGANLTFQRSRIAEVVGATCIKLLVAPLVVAAVLRIFGFAGRDYMLILLQLSAPVALVSTVFVERYTGNQEYTAIAANAVALSTICSLVTIPVIYLCL